MEDKDLLQRVLRVTHEPCRSFSDNDVHQRLVGNPLAYYQYVRKALVDIANNAATLELPPKQLFVDPGGSGDFRVMPCVFRRRKEVIKTVKLVGTNLVQQRIPDQITVGKACLLDPQENFVSHWFDACLLSSARTGLCATLAIELLAGDRLSDPVAVVGAGRVGFYAAFFCASVLEAKEVTIRDINRDQAHLACQLLAELAPRTKFRIADDNDVRNADVVVLATSSKKPVFNIANSAAGLVVSVGADTDDQSEIFDEGITDCSLYVDTKDSSRYGDLNRWLEKGLIQVNDLTDLFALSGPEHVRRGNEKRVFISTGSALFDNLTIGYLTLDA